MVWNRDELGNRLLRVIVTGERAIVLDTDEEQASVTIGESCDGLRDGVSHRSSIQMFPRPATPIPDGFELEELPFVSFEKSTELGFGE